MIGDAEFLLNWLFIVTTTKLINTAQLSNSRIGALQWLPYGETPGYEIGCEIKQLLAAETAVQLVDQPDLFSKNFGEMSLLYLANAGTGVGGASTKSVNP